MMTFEEFCAEMQDRLENEFGGQIDIKPTVMVKSNDCEYHGFIMHKKGEKISPTIYLEQFYEDYCEDMPLEMIVQDFCHYYRASMMKEEIDLSFYTDYEQVKKKLCMKVVSREKNRVLLKHLPYVEFLDLAVIFYCNLDTLALEDAVLYVNLEHMSKWGVDEQTLYEDALAVAQENTPVKIYHMREVLMDFLGEEAFMNLPDLTDTIPLMVMTNSKKKYGASTILYGNALKDYAALCGKNLYIIPSSVHEVLLLEKTDDDAKNQLLSMIHEVNTHHVPKGEILSDNLYEYDLERQGVFLCAKP